MIADCSRSNHSLVVGSISNTPSSSFVASGISTSSLMVPPFGGWGAVAPSLTRRELTIKLNFLLHWYYSPFINVACQVPSHNDGPSTGAKQAKSTCPTALSYAPRLMGKLGGQRSISGAVPKAECRRINGRWTRGAQRSCMFGL